MSWKNEPVRHACSSYGIKTKDYSQVNSKNKAPPKDLFPIDWFKLKENDSTEVKKAIKLYWWCSSTDNWDWFDFDDVFKSIRMGIDNWLKFNISEYKVYVSGKGYQPVMKGMPISTEEAISLIKKGKYRKLKNKGKFESSSRYAGVWREKIVDMLDMAIKMKKQNNLSLDEKINLFDNVIHQEHMRSRHKSDEDSWYGIDVDELRQEFEEEYL